MSPRSRRVLGALVLALTALVLSLPTAAHAGTATTLPCFFSDDDPYGVDVNGSYTFYAACMPGTDPVEVVEDLAPGNGTVTWAPEEGEEGVYALTYTPDEDFEGDDHYEFHLENDDGSSPTYEVDFEVSSTGPSCFVDAQGTATTYRTRPRRTVYVPFACDEGMFDAVEDLSSPEGTVDVDPDGFPGFIFTPGSSTTARTVNVTYTLLVGGDEVAVTQPIQIAAATNHAPVCIPDDDGSGQPAPLEVRAGDTELFSPLCFDPDEDVLTAAAETGNEAIATVDRPSRDEDGGFGADVHGVLAGATTLSWSVSDGTESDGFETPITVTPPPDPPGDSVPQCSSPGSPPGTVSGFRGRQRTISISCFDADGDQLTLALDGANAPSNGTVTPLAGTSFRYTPSSAAITADSFRVIVSDTDGNTIPLPFTINLQTVQPPTCSTPSQITTRPGKELFVDMACSNGPGDPLTYSISGPAAQHATHADPQDDFFTFDAPATPGTYEVDFYALFAGEKSETVTQQIVVDPNVNSAPECSTDAGEWDFFSMLVRQGGSRTFSIECFDDDDDAMTVMAQPSTTRPSPRGTLGTVEQEPDGSHAEVLYSAPAGIATGPDFFDWRVDDGRAPVREVQTVIVRPQSSNHAPLDCPRVVSGDAPRSGDSYDVEVFCDDPEGDAVTAEVIGQPQHGDVGTPTSDEHGITIPYTSDAGYTGPDELKIQFADASGALSAPAVVELDVQPASSNSAPYCDADALAFEVEAGESIQIPHPECFDDDGDVVSLAITDEPDQGELTSVTGGWTYTADADADPATDDTFAFEARDDGPAIDWTEYVAEVDITPGTVVAGPTIGTFTITPSSTPTSQRLRTFAWGDAPGATRFVCTIDGDVVDNCPSPFPVNLANTPANEGTHTFSVQAFNAQNVGGTVRSHTWVLDTVAPDTGAITGGLTAGKSRSTVNFDAFTSPNGGVAFECRLTKTGQAVGGFSACPAGETFTGLTDGQYKLEVRAVDAAANADPSPSEVTWTVDLTGAPIIGLTAIPNTAVTNDTSRRFTWDGEAGSTFTCRLDGDPLPESAGACDKDVTVPVGEGSHLFSVFATDALGNEGDAAMHVWEVDLTAPNTTGITGGPTGRTKSTTATFTSFDATGGHSAIECRLTRDGTVVQAFFVCAPANFQFEGLADGEYVLTVRAKDAAGNVDSSDLPTRSWTVDATAPQTDFVTGGPGDPTNQTTATFGPFTSSASDVAGYTCRLERGPAVLFDAVCPENRTFTGLTDGVHTLHVRAFDDLGNTDATASTRTWTVDTVAPTVQNLTAPGGTSPTNATTRRFTWSSNETPSFYTCELDDVPYTADCDGDVTVPAGDTQGTRKFEVRASDIPGNDGAFATATWVFDSVAPDTNALTGFTATRTRSQSADFDAFGGTGDPASFQCRLLRGGNEVSTSCADPAGLVDGSYRFEVRAVDAAGNVDATPAVHEWTVDTTGPAVLALTGDESRSPTNTATRRFTWDGEAGATYVCRFNSAPLPESAGACDEDVTLTPTTQGNQSFTVQAVDDLGNEGAVETRGWIFDSLAPETFVASGPKHGSTTSNPSPRIVGRSNESGATFQCRVDSAVTWGPCPTGGTLADGPHSIEIKAIDAAGNEDASPTKIDWTIGDGAPAVTEGNIAPGTPLTTAPDAANPTADQPVTLKLASPVATTVTVTENESAGGGTPGAGFSFVGYQVVFDSTELETPQATPIELEFELHESLLPDTIDASNVDTIVVYRDGIALPRCGAQAACVVEIDPITSGATFVGARIQIRTDHLSDWNFAVDTTAPTVTIGGHSGEDADGDVAFTYTASEGAATFECSLDGGAFASCPAGGKSYSSLADGAHTFSVRATDAAGNRGAAASRAFTVKRPAKAADGGGTKTTSGGTTTTTATPPPVTLGRTPARGLSLSLLPSPKQKLAAALKSGVSMALQCSAACSIDGTLSVTGAVAKKLKLAKNARKPVVVAKGRASGNGRVVLKLAFTAKAKKALRRQRSVALTLGGTATGNGVPVPLRGAVTLKK